MRFKKWFQWSINLSISLKITRPGRCNFSFYFSVKSHLFCESFNHLRKAVVILFNLRGICTVFKGFVLNIIEIAGLEFKLANYNVTDKHISHYARATYLDWRLTDWFLGGGARLKSTFGSLKGKWKISITLVKRIFGAKKKTHTVLDNLIALIPKMTLVFHD